MDPRKHSQAQSVFWDNSPSPRLLEFRKVTADHIAAIRNVAVDLNIIAVPLGAILIIGGWRDEVIHPDLVFLVYKLLINLIGARGILLCLIEKIDFHLWLDDLDNSISDHIKLLILNFLHNSIGGILQPDDPDAISYLIHQHVFLCRVDEVYSRTHYEEKPHNIIEHRGMKDCPILEPAL